APGVELLDQLQLAGRTLVLVEVGFAKSVPKLVVLEGRVAEEEQVPAPDDGPDSEPSSHEAGALGRVRQRDRGQSIERPIAESIPREANRGGRRGRSDAPRRESTVRPCERLRLCLAREVEDPPVELRDAQVEVAAAGLS